MSKPLKMLVFVLAATVALGAGVWLLLTAPQETAAPEDNTLYLESRTPDQIQSITVDNLSGGYSLEKEGEGYRLHDIPAEQVNSEYLDMLLDEASSIQYLTEVTDDLSRLADYGLAEPEAVVEITYTDGASRRLLIGAKEPVDSGRYFMEDGGDKILLMKDNRSIRFTMPVENYIDFIIIPPEETTSVLSELQDITFSGTSLETPIVLKAVLPERADLQRTGLSYGALTHLVVEPGLHEASATALSTIADQLFGLISEGIVAYNCTEEELAAYGFDEPWLQIDFDYKNGKEAPVTPYCLRVSQDEEGYIATVNDEGIVYRILDQDFLHITYNDVVLRWFVSPFITDVEQLTISSPDSEYTYKLEGATAKELTVTDGQGNPMDSTSFSSLFNLTTSAASDGALLAEEPALPDEPLLTVRYQYHDAEKPDDVLNFYDAGQRRLYVEVNGVCEASMRQNYLDVLLNACAAYSNGESFSVEW